MIHRIENITGINLLGIRTSMSFADNRTVEIWQKFMPQKKSVQHLCSVDLYSVEIYPVDFFTAFDANNKFEKWAAVKVGSFENQPEQFERLIIPAGLYAVFLYRGAANNAPMAYNYIFREWLPASGFRLAHRPHFALMGAKYKNDDPLSEEEIWIPVEPI